MPELRSVFKVNTQTLFIKIRKFFKIKKSPKRKGYKKFLTEEEQRFDVNI